MSFQSEGIREAGTTAFQRLSEILQEAHGILAPELVTLDPRDEWQGDPSQLVVFDDDKHPVSVKEAN